MNHRWFLVGFTSDAICGVQQDARMAEACVKAWIAAGCPAACRILEALGSDDYWLYWFINEAAAGVLDGAHVGWRALVIAERSDAPSDGREILLAKWAA